MSHPGHFHNTCPTCGKVSQCRCNDPGKAHTRMLCDQCIRRKSAGLSDKPKPSSGPTVHEEAPCPTIGYIRLLPDPGKWNGVAWVDVNDPWISAEVMLPGANKPVLVEWPDGRIEIHQGLFTEIPAFWAPIPTRTKA